MPGKASPNAVPKATAKKLAFAERFVALGNGTQAYIAAGYSPKGAGRQVSRMLSDPVVSAEIARIKAQNAPLIAKKTVADMAELHEHFTSQLRADVFSDDIRECEGDMEEKLKALSSLRAAAMKVESPELLATMSMRILETVDSIAEHRLKIKDLRLRQQAVRNKAGETLYRVNGAFDPKSPAVDDPGALLNSTLRAMIEAKWQPPKEIGAWHREATDAAFSISDDSLPPGTGDPADAGAPAERTGGGDPVRVLFTRAAPPKTDP